MKKGETFDINPEPLLHLFFNSLSEKDRRVYSGLEAIRLGAHGVSYVSSFYNIHPHTVRAGKKELLSGNLLPSDKVRRKGGGRKKKTELMTNLVNVLMVIILPFTAGSPLHESIRWTNLSWTRISDLLKERGFNAGRYVVKKLMKYLGYCRRKMVKCKTLAQVAFRNEQFEYINKLKNEFINNGLPVLSIDSKKKEMIGNFYRDGYLLTHEQVNVFDHDFKSFSKGTVVPHGIYDIFQNICYLTIGQSSDTIEFVCDNLRYYWENYIKFNYPAAKKILLLCDGGGSNGCRFHVVKEALYLLSKELKIEIVVAHYPAYCSKWNPIEHKAFCHIHKAWEGIVFDSYQTVIEWAKKATTKTGFYTEVWHNKKEYKTGKKASDDFLDKYPVKFNEFLPKWNYAFISD